MRASAGACRINCETSGISAVTIFVVAVLDGIAEFVSDIQFA